MSLPYMRDKPYSNLEATDPKYLHASSPSHSSRLTDKADGPSRLQWAVILTICLVGGWFFANAVYTHGLHTHKAEVVTIKLDQDTIDALAALLHANGKAR